MLSSALIRVYFDTSMCLKHCELLCLVEHKVAADIFPLLLSNIFGSSSVTDEQKGELFGHLHKIIKDKYDFSTLNSHDITLMKQKQMLAIRALDYFRRLEVRKFSPFVKLDSSSLSKNTDVSKLSRRSKNNSRNLAMFTHKLALVDCSMSFLDIAYRLLSLAIC